MHTRWLGWSVLIILEWILGTTQLVEQLNTKSTSKEDQLKPAKPQLVFQQGCEISEFYIINNLQSDSMIKNIHLVSFSIHFAASQKINLFAKE